MSVRELLILSLKIPPALFFGPSITGLLGRGRENVGGNILVLSQGNNYGLGSTREDEMKRACMELGIVRMDRCVVLNNK
jgi:N-acetylglucosaminylphosphatidylinositol deacetylase